MSRPRLLSRPYTAAKLRNERAPLIAPLSFNYPGHHNAATPLPGMPAPEGHGSLSVSHAVEDFAVDLSLSVTSQDGTYQYAWAQLHARLHHEEAPF